MRSERSACQLKGMPERWSLAKKVFRLAIGPEKWLKKHIVRRFGASEKSDQLTLRTALLWGWCVDRFRRNVAVAAKVRELGGEGRLRVLDAGAGDFGVGAFLPPDKFGVCSVDVDWMMLARNRTSGPAVVASGCSLPFSDGAFDVVVSVDCLEHVPPKHRSLYLRELARVARRRVVLHFPALGPPEFQGEVFDFLFHNMYRWTRRKDLNIEEHLRNGLPQVRDVAARFPGCAVSGRENCDLWVRYMLLDRMPYLCFMAGAMLWPSRNDLDKPPYHAALLVYDKACAGSGFAPKLGADSRNGRSEDSLWTL